MLEESKKALVAPQEVDDRRPVQRPRNKYLETLRVPHFLLMVVSFCSKPQPTGTRASLTVSRYPVE